MVYVTFPPFLLNALLFNVSLFKNIALDAEEKMPLAFNDQKKKKKNRKKKKRVLVFSECSPILDLSYMAKYKIFFIYSK